MGTAMSCLGGGLGKRTKKPPKTGAVKVSHPTRQLSPADEDADDRRISRSPSASVGVHHHNSQLRSPGTSATEDPLNSGRRSATERFLDDPRDSGRRSTAEPVVNDHRDLQPAPTGIGNDDDRGRSRRRSMAEYEDSDDPGRAAERNRDDRSESRPSSSAVDGNSDVRVEPEPSSVAEDGEGEDEWVTPRQSLEWAMEPVDMISGVLNNHLNVDLLTYPLGNPEDGEEQLEEATEPVDAMDMISDERSNDLSVNQDNTVEAETIHTSVLSNPQMTPADPQSSSVPSGTLMSVAATEFHTEIETESERPTTSSTIDLPLSGSRNSGTPGPPRPPGDDPVGAVVMPYKQSGWTYVLYLVLYILLGSAYYASSLAVSIDTQFSGGRLSFRDSLYFATQTISSVGYGDLLPISTLSKVFVVCYIPYGLWIVAMVYEVASASLGRGEDWVFDKFIPLDNDRVNRISANEKRIAVKIAFSFSCLVLCIAGGARALNRWEELRGFDPVYVSVVSVSTVGFGDLTFKSSKGRLFFPFWILLACFFVYRVVALITLLTESRRRIPAFWIPPVNRFFYREWVAMTYWMQVWHWH